LVVDGAPVAKRPGAVDHEGLGRRLDPQRLGERAIRVARAGGHVEHDERDAFLAEPRRELLDPRSIALRDRALGVARDDDQSIGTGKLRQARVADSVAGHVAGRGRCAEE